MGSPSKAVTSGLKPYQGPWDHDTVQHLLKRTMFGATQEDIHYFMAKGMHDSLQELIYTNEALPGPPLNAYSYGGKNNDPDVPFGRTWIDAPTYTGDQNNPNGLRRNSFQSWWFELMFFQRRTIREKMVLFWHNHFATETRIIQKAIFCYQYNQLLRTHALANFRVFLKVITCNPAMLYYLNGDSNTNVSPNENYGRELQELFAIGKGPGSHYTESDIKEAARVLTGWIIDYRTNAATTQFVSYKHDNGDKHFSSFYGNKVIKGQKGPDGEKETDELLDMICAQHEVALFICRKLYRFFIYHEIDSVTEKNIIAPLAAIFRKNNYNIQPVLLALFSSEHFFDKANRGGIIKSPADFTIGLLRECRVPIPTDLAGRYNVLYNLQSACALQQQQLGQPPNVAGWPAYYQAPEYDKLWINSVTLPARNQFVEKIVSTGIKENNFVTKIDVLKLTQTLSDPGDPNSLIAELAQYFFINGLPAEQQDYVKSKILLGNLQSGTADHYWTQAWERLQQQPSDTANTKDVQSKLEELYKYLLRMPNYHLI
ncbi:DUF1800 domain-containing protein [Deminuibacter soli]|uniref:DUF1800 domain-containing protein n=1 Tax=Deminuibacter soli TaxID=2291815 RepID=A0A3E1NHK7_9BACT|nr:DUF1800 domain-containing protein [Deminuibacter soli]RFM27387.1 DUF1800 domain-containing protein [Deminuibacter soli]